MIFEHKVKGSFTIEQFEEELRKHTFVKDLEILPFTSRPLFVKVANTYLAVKAQLASILPSMFGTKLTQTDFKDEKTLSKVEHHFISQCNEERQESDKPMIMLNIFKFNQSNNNDIYNDVTMNIFPKIGSRLFIEGEPDSDYWDRLTFVRYQSRQKWCEMVLSEQFLKTFHLEKNCFDDSNTFMTYAVPSYRRDFLANWICTIISNSIKSVGLGQINPCI